MSDAPLTLGMLQTVLDMGVNKIMDKMDERLGKLEEGQSHLRSFLLSGSDVKKRVEALEVRIQENELLDREQLVLINFLVEHAKQNGVSVPAPILQIINKVDNNPTTQNNSDGAIGQVGQNQGEVK